MTTTWGRHPFSGQRFVFIHPWFFCWTETGTKCVGTVQSLVATCRLHQVDQLTLPNDREA